MFDDVIEKFSDEELRALTTKRNEWAAALIGTGLAILKEECGMGNVLGDDLTLTSNRWVEFRASNRGIEVLERSLDNDGKPCTRAGWTFNVRGGFQKNYGII